jgi:hypothetical protein
MNTIQQLIAEIQQDRAIEEANIAAIDSLLREASLSEAVAIAVIATATLDTDSGAHLLFTVDPNSGLIQEAAKLLRPLRNFIKIVIAAAILNDLAANEDDENCDDDEYEDTKWNDIKHEIITEIETDWDWNPSDPIAY